MKMRYALRKQCLRFLAWLCAAPWDMKAGW